MPTGTNEVERRAAFAVAPHTISDVQSAISRYRSRRGADPFYVVMDASSFRSIFTPFDIATSSTAVAFSEWRPRTAHLLGFEVVVIATDGLPMLQVVGTPSEEASRP